jgi:hypothetical protein
MLKIKNEKEIPVNSLRTSCCYTGKALDESKEIELYSVKEKLLLQALKEYKELTTCGLSCFQIKENKLIFWFNIKETTRTLSTLLDKPINFIHHKNPHKI